MNEKKANPPKIIFGRIDDDPPEPLFLEAPNFEDIVTEEEYLSDWYIKMIELAKLNENEVRNYFQRLIVRHYLKNQSLLSKLLDSQGILKRASFKMISLDHISGYGIRIPVFGFKKNDYISFLQQARLDFAQGYTLSFSLDSRKSRRLSVVVYSTEQLPESMPPEQIRQHELFHAIDPNFDRRNGQDGVLITELVAVIGEITGGENDNIKVFTELSFWLTYTKKIMSYSSSCLAVLSMTKEESAKPELVAQKMSDYVRRITRKSNNTKLVLELMTCITFADVLNIGIN